MKYQIKELDGRFYPEVQYECGHHFNPIACKWSWRKKVPVLWCSTYSAAEKVIKNHKAKHDEQERKIREAIIHEVKL